MNTRPSLNREFCLGGRHSKDIIVWHENNLRGLHPKNIYTKGGWTKPWLSQDPFIMHIFLSGFKVALWMFHWLHFQFAGLWPLSVALQLLFLLVCVCVCVQSVSREWLFVTPWVCSLPGSSVHEDSPGRRAGVGLPFPTPGNLPNSGIKPTSLVSPELGGGFFTSAPPGKLFLLINLKLIRAYLPKKYCILSLPC